MLNFLRNLNKKQIMIMSGVSVVVLILIVLLCIIFTSSDSAQEVLITNTTNADHNTTKTSKENEADNNKNSLAAKEVQQGDKKFRQIVINNFNKYEKNISDQGKINLQIALQNTIELSNKDKSPQKINSISDANIRDGSYSQKYEDMVYHTEFIVDIPSYRQTYRLTSFWSEVPELAFRAAGDYTVNVFCPKPEELIYEPFNCIDRFKIEQGME